MWWPEPFDDNNDDDDDEAFDVNNDDDDLKQTPFILQWSIRFLGGSDEPQRARTITFTWWSYDDDDDDDDDDDEDDFDDHDDIVLTSVSSS